MTTNKSTHCVEIYEPSDYSGPHPLCARAIGVIAGPERVQGYLLDLLECLSVDDQECRQIIVRPRHQDPIERVVSSACTIIIYCVKPDTRLDAGSEFKYTDVINWGIGKIRPLDNGNA